MPPVDPVPILQELIRFDTTNPPGSERACVDYLDELLSGAGFATERLVKDPERPILLTRLEGRGEAPPLLLYGHVDVVEADGERWTYPPFAGTVAEGAVWGRGALDMKGGVAMMVAALLGAQADDVRPRGDVLLAVLPDEEAGGEHGAVYLTEEHPDRLAGVRWAIGEFGGFPLHLSGQTFYPVQVTEKGICWLEATVRGRGGHGSIPRSGGTMARLAELLQALDRWEAPHRVTPPVRDMVEAMAASADPPLDRVFRDLLDVESKPGALEALGDSAPLFEAVLQNTATPTVVRAGSKVNVVPSEARVKIDGRPLPGVGAGELISELRQAVGEEVALGVERSEEIDGETDLELFPLLAELLREADPEARPVPLVVLGGTDGRFFRRLGIQTYGYLPLDLPEGFDFLNTIHGVDERVPVDALAFGTSILGELLQRYPG